MCECVSIRRFHFGWSEPVCTRAAHPLLWIRTFPLWIGASHQGTVVLVRSLPAHKGWPTTCLILATTYSGLVHGGTGADRWAQNGSSHSRAFWRFPNVDFFYQSRPGTECRTAARMFLIPVPIHTAHDNNNKCISAAPGPFWYTC